MTIETTSGAQTTDQSSQGNAADAPQGGTAPVAEGDDRQKDPLEFARRFASLTKTEKRILAQKKQMDAERVEFEEFRRSKGLAKTNVAEFLKSHGLTYEEITEKILKNDPNATPEDRVALLQKQIDEDRAERQREKDDLLAEKQQAAIDNHRTAIRSHVDSLGDKYEIIAANDEYDTVFDVIEEHFMDSGEIMPIDKACQLVDDYLTEKAKKALGLKRFQPQGTPNDDRPDTTRPPTGESFTLTNQAAAAPNLTQNRGEPLSDDEAKRRAAAKIQWN